RTEGHSPFVDPGKGAAETMLSSLLLIISLTLFALLGVTPARAADRVIAWQDWSETAFAQAQRENRSVLLDLGAVWCHWCHVMERDTYDNPAVADLIRARYDPVRVDQDAGYVPAARMISVLEHILSDLSPTTYHDGLFEQTEYGFFRARQGTPSWAPDG